MDILCTCVKGHNPFQHTVRQLIKDNHEFYYLFTSQTLIQKYLKKGGFDRVNTTPICTGMCFRCLHGSEKYILT